MTDPHNPLITGVTNNPSDRSLDKLPTSYAVNQLFSGESLAANTNLDNVITCGNYRFNTTCTNLPSHMQGSTAGILTVMHDRYTTNTNPATSGFPVTPATPNTATVIRQVAWPDGPMDVTPYTRTKKAGVWGAWQTMGGGLRRIRMTGNVAEAAVQTNVMYYSFGNFALNLPDPTTANYSLGTKIGLEQYIGNGSVTSPNPADTGNPFNIVTSPTYAMDNNGAATTTNIGPTTYIFEVVEGSTVGSKQWVLDMDNDNAARLQGIEGKISAEATTRLTNDNTLQSNINSEINARNAADVVLQNNINSEANTRYNTDTSLGNRITTEVSDRKAADNAEASARSAADSSEANTRNAADVTLQNNINSEANTRNAADVALQNNINNKQKLEKIYLVNGWTLNSVSFADGNSVSKNIKDLLFLVTPIISITTNCTCWLPYAPNYPIGTKVTIEITGAYTATIIVANSSGGQADSEAFTNSTGSVLVLPFEVTYGTDGTQIWSLLVAG